MQTRLTCAASPRRFKTSAILSCQDVVASRIGTVAKGFQDGLASLQGFQGLAFELLFASNGSVFQEFPRLI